MRLHGGLVGLRALQKRSELLPPDFFQKITTEFGEGRIDPPDQPGGIGQDEARRSLLFPTLDRGQNTGFEFGLRGQQFRADQRSDGGRLQQPGGKAAQFRVTFQEKLEARSLPGAHRPGRVKSGLLLEMFGIHVRFLRLITSRRKRQMRLPLVSRVGSA